MVPAQEPAQQTIADRPSADRGLIPGLRSPAPIGEGLPAMYQEDEFAQRLTTAFDEVMAPIFTTLDCVDSYLDPHLAPGDFVDWLASWVGVEIDETWSLPRRRKLISDAVALYRVRGTAAGLAAHLGLYAGETPEIVESGGCGWSATANTELPGSPAAELTVRLQVADATAINARTVQRIVAASRPAHVAYQVEITGDRAALPSGDASIDLDGVGSLPDAEPALGLTPDHPAGPAQPPGAESVELAAPGPKSAEAVEVIPGPEQSPPEGEEPPA